MLFMPCHSERTFLLDGYTNSVFHSLHRRFSIHTVQMGSGNSHPVSRFHLTAQDVINECDKNGTINNLSILVTGATSGIGIETSRVLAFNGAKVFLMGRDKSKLEDVVNSINNELKPSIGSVQGVVCDLNSLASVKQFAQKFLQENSFLNVLILNAGIINYRFAQTVDGLEQVMGVNHIAHAYLTQLLMPLLINSVPSRVVVVSSRAHIGPALDYQALDRMNTSTENAQKGWGTFRSYQQSKLANILFARALASRFGDKGVTAYSLHPGAIKTNLGSRVPLSKYLAPVVFTFLKEKNIAEGAATTVYCAVQSGLESENGRYFDDSTVADSADRWTEEDLNRFWEWTENVIDQHTTHL